MRIFPIIAAWCIICPSIISSSTIFRSEITSTEYPTFLSTPSLDSVMASTADGSFNATVIQEEKNLGYVSGFIWLGRKDDTGICRGMWQAANGTIAGNVTTLFYGRYIIGVVQRAQGFCPFVGMLSFEEECFSIQVLTLGITLLKVEGTYFASFLPQPTGPYSIGTQIVHLVDQSREEQLSDDPEDHREMMVQLWYPADSLMQGELVDYMGPETFEWLRNQGPIPLFWIPKEAYTYVHTHALMDVPIAGGTRFPVVFFSHGYRGYPSMYTSITEELASHGFVVVAITHPYIAGITVFPDGRTIDITQITFNDENESLRYFEIAFQEVLGDISFVYDYVADLNETDVMWKGTLDMLNVGIFGHSFGGGAAADICAHDNRFRAGLALDGYFRGDLIGGGTNTSFLTMFAEGRFDADQTVQQFWKNLSGDSYRIDIIGSAHQDFTDLPILLSHLAPLIPRHLLPGFGTIEGKRLAEIINAYDLAFFNTYLRGGTPDAIINLANRFDEILFYYK